MLTEEISIEEKVQAVEAYLRGEVKLGLITERYRIARQSFYVWVRNYQSMGIEGFKGKRYVRYSQDVKEAAVKEYLSGTGSQNDICRKYKIRSRRQLQNWIKQYNGHKESKSSMGQRSDIYMTKGRKTTYEERVEIVSYCIEHGNDYLGTAEKYGVSYQQIHSWVKKQKEKGESGLVDRRGKRKPEDEMSELEKLRAANRLLEAQNKRLEMENAVLKKLEELERRCR